MRQGSNLGPLASEASTLTTEIPGLYRLEVRYNDKNNRHKHVCLMQATTWLCLSRKLVTSSNINIYFLNRAIKA